MINVRRDRTWQYRTVVRILVVCVTFGQVLQTSADDDASLTLRLRDLSTADHRLVYKHVGDKALHLYGFEPPTKPAQQNLSQRAVIVLLHGGGWTKGTPASVAPHARYFASRGMLAFTAEYQLHSPNNGITVKNAIEDVRDIVAYLNNHAAELDLNPEAIVLGGGSAGGHLAAAAAIIPSSQPDGTTVPPPTVAGLVLFNPVLLLTPQRDLPPDRPRPEALFGPDLTRICPYNHLREGLPPMIALYGEKDPLVIRARRYGERSRSFNNRFDLDISPNKKHGFYHLGNRASFVKVCRASDAFLVSLELLSGEPHVVDFVSQQSAEPLTIE